MCRTSPVDLLGSKESGKLQNLIVTFLRMKYEIIHAVHTNYTIRFETHAYVQGWSTVEHLVFSRRLEITGQYLWLSSANVEAEHLFYPWVTTTNVHQSEENIGLALPDT